MLTDDLSYGYMETQRAQGEGGLFPAGISLLADPEQLNHQEGPLEEYHNGGGEHDPLLGSTRSDAYDSEDDGKTGGPDSGVEEQSNYDWCMSGRGNRTTRAFNLPM